MTFVNRRGFIKTLLASAALGALFTVVPLHIGSHDAGLSLAWNFANADDGSDDEDNSGSGSGDDDNSGSDDGDDNSGSGGGDDNEDEDEDEDDDDGGDDDDGNSGNGGSSNSGGGNSGSGGNGGSGGASWFILNDGTRVEIANGGREIKLFYANGWREEIRGGRYVLRDEENRLVVDRAVTDDDYARLQGLLAA